MSRAALFALLVLATPAGAQDLLNGFLIGPDPTKDSHEQDAQIRESQTEREWIVHSRLHPKKRVYDNLRKPQRAEYRARERELARLYWMRGAMNDPLRAFEVLEGPNIFRDQVQRDPCGEDPNPCEPQKEMDLEARLEDGQMAGWLASQQAGERLIPPSNVEHLMFQERLKAPHVGLGQERIGFAQRDPDLVKDRVHRHFKWGKYKDEDHWKDKLEGLKLSLRDRRPSVVTLMGNIPRLQKRTEELVHNPKGDRTAFSKKNELYRGVLRSMGSAPQIDVAIELIIEAEILTAKLALGELHASETPGRNQMAGMALVIAGAATAYLEVPHYRTLTRLGAVGVLGARGAPVTR